MRLRASVRTGALFFCRPDHDPPVFTPRGVHFEFDPLPIPTHVPASTPRSSLQGLMLMLPNRRCLHDLFVAATSTPPTTRPIAVWVRPYIPHIIVPCVTYTPKAGNSRSSQGVLGNEPARPHLTIVRL